VKRFSIIIACLFAALLLPSPRTNADGATNPKSQWMRTGQYGVMIRFLGDDLTDWNTRVNAFNVNDFASQMHDAGAAWVILTLGGPSGYFCSPNAAYTQAISALPGAKCSTRDLPMELGDALAKQNIRLILSLPIRAPSYDPAIVKALGDNNNRQPAPQAFTPKWQEILREWSQRYGARVSGWWLDEVFNTEGFADPEKPANWKTIADALRAGNHDTLIACNAGHLDAFKKIMRYQDFTAGERTAFDATPLSHPADDDIQWHLVSFLGKSPAPPTAPANPTTG